MISVIQPFQNVYKLKRLLIMTMQVHKKRMLLQKVYEPNLLCFSLMHIFLLTFCNICLEPQIKPQTYFCKHASIFHTGRKWDCLNFKAAVHYTLYAYAELSLAGVLGVLQHPQNLGVLLTLFQPEGAHYAHSISTPGFQNLTTALPSQNIKTASK